MERSTTANPKDDEISRGLCQCGCGGKTSIAKTSDQRRGQVNGEPLRFVRGHHGRKRLRYIETPTGYKLVCV